MINLVKIFDKLLKKKNKFKLIDYPKNYPADEPMRRCPNINKAIKDTKYNPKISIKDGVGIANVVGRNGSLSFQADVDNAVSGTSINFAVDGAERFRIDSYGNVGVGTEPRTAAGGINNDTNVMLVIGDNDTGIAQDGDGQFEIWANNQEIANFNASSVTLTKDLFIPDKLRHDGDSDTQIRFPADDTVTVETGGNERLRITSGGAVGINESSPAAQLHVENDNANASTYYLNTDAAILVQNKNSNATAKTVLKLEGPGGGGDCALVYGGGSTNLIIADRQNERLRITSGGAVSVGNNASPDGKLHVYSSSAGTVTADGDADELVLESSGNTGMSILSPGTGESSIYFGNPGTNGQKDAWIKYYHETHATVADRRSLTFRTSGGERLRIKSDGKVGINTVTPTYGSHLHGTGASNNAYYMAEQSSAGASEDLD